MPASQPAYFNLQEFTDAGQLLVGGRLYTYGYGTTAHKTAYTDPDGTVPHTYTPDGMGGQYIALNARGELLAPLYLGDGSYDIALKRPDGSTVWTRKADGIENSLKAWKSALAAASGASLVGYQAGHAGAVKRTLQDKARECVSPQDFGAKIGEDCTNALLKFRDALAAGAAGWMPPGDYLYNRAAGGVLEFNCPILVLSAEGARIRCSAYPVAGATSIVELVKIRADKIYLTGLTVDGGWQLIAGRADNHCVENGLFNYMHGLSISADGGFIDNITVHDVQGIGFTTETDVGGMSNVQLGKVTTHHNWMIGTDFRSLQYYVEDLTVTQLLSYRNGTRGAGWVQINFGDNTLNSGTRRINVGVVLTMNGGGSSMGLGQYANGSTGAISGARDINIGVHSSYNETGHGVEFYACVNCNITSLAVVGAGRKGLYVERSDTNDVFGYVNTVGSARVTECGEDGALISGANNIQFGALTSWNNGTSGPGFSNLKLYSPSGLAQEETGHVQIDQLRLFNDKGPGAQVADYNLAFAFFGSPGGTIQIGSADLSNAKVADLAWLVSGASTNKVVSFGTLTYETIFPSYADKKRIQMAVDRKLEQRWRTADATPDSSLLAAPTPGRDCIVQLEVTGRSGDGSIMHFMQQMDFYKWTGAGFTKLASRRYVDDFKTGATDAYSNNVGAGIHVVLTGLADTSIDWDVGMTFSSGIDQEFAV